MRIDIIVYDGLDELDAVGPLEVLRGAATAGADLDVRLAGRTDLTPVVGTFGLTFTPEVVFTPGEADVVVVPGGGWAGRTEHGAWGEVQRGDWLGPLAAAADTGTLDGQRLHRRHAAGPRRRDRHPHRHHPPRRPRRPRRHRRRRRHGPGGRQRSVITGGGVTSGIDVGLHLVERLVGPEAAEAAARRMEYTRHPVLVVDED